ncbi:S9 family peptidase [Fibrella forsythiae]|uniref:DPP IV N-terminal domain-containing protein n=1 Tax=Fibrella forsythiae TaxID=2817061 RepID=A0ABS3JID4_9BACT|nr:S9 family peptidase [Fibrella forsythiae]MBO0949774.1 DPP IV N-terminal domain-containing protein [Fibrella forsythiae]
MQSTKQGFLLLISVLLTISGNVLAQGKLADYQRAEALKTKLKDKVYNAPQQINWTKNGSRCWYVIQTARGKEFVVVDPKQKTRQLAFDQEQLAQKLAAATGKKIEPFNLPFTTLNFGKDDEAVEFVAEGFTWQYGPGAMAFSKKGPFRAEPTDRRYWGANSSELSDRAVPSPDSSQTAYIKNYNLYVRSEKTKQERQLSFDGSEGDYYASTIQWSPDSKKIATNKIRPNVKHLIYFVRSSPDDQLQPKLENREYLKPGDALPVRRPQLFLVDEGKQIPVDDALFNQQFSLSRLEWRKDSRAFTFEYNQRGHQVYRVLEVSAATGAVRPLVEERSNTFIDYSGKRYRFDLADGKEMVWASERDGWNHLYLIDGATGKVKKQLTKGEWVVRNVVTVDTASRTILFAASGKTPGQDPYFTQYYRVNLDGTNLTALTTEDANHVATFAPDFKTFVDSYSRVDMPPVTVLRSATDGSVLVNLEKADISEWQKAGWQTPDVFTAKARDGKTDIWGIIVRPTNFDPTKTYPVIENIYAGPHGSFTPKSFMATNRSMHELAELGFIVVQLDGMGTSNRSKAFQDVCWKNLKDAGFPDRILWMQAAAKKYPFMDLSRVGIYGTSAGGQSAAGALLFHPEFYKVAVSSCGCHDNRMDKIWWNEQWMGYPVGPQYAECSNVVNAHKLQGNLLLMVGEVDDNVDPASTMQVADALIKANKNFDLVVLPGLSHTSGGDFGERKRRDFFVKHLLNTDPPAWTATTSGTGAVGMGK